MIDERLKMARVRPRFEGDVTLVRLRGISPLIMFVGTVCVAVVVGAFAGPIVAMLFNPRPVPGWLIITAGVVVIVIASALAVRRRRQIQTGYDDLIIDREARAVSLPLNFGRREPVAIPVEQIVRVAPADELPKSPDSFDADTFGPRTYRLRNIVPDDELPRVGHRGEMRYVVVIVHRSPDGEEQIAPIVRWADARRANALAGWLQDELARGRDP